MWERSNSWMFFPPFLHPNQHCRFTLVKPSEATGSFPAWEREREYPAVRHGHYECGNLYCAVANSTILTSVEDGENFQRLLSWSLKSDEIIYPSVKLCCISQNPFRWTRDGIVGSRDWLYQVPSILNLPCRLHETPLSKMFNFPAFFPLARQFYGDATVLINFSRGS